MIAENPGLETSSTDLLLRLVSEVAHSLAQTEISKLPQVLCRIVEAACQLFPDLREGSVSLLDYVFEEQYLLALPWTPSSLVTQQKVSGPTLIPDFPRTSNSEVSLVIRQDGSCLIRVPVVVGSRDVGLLSLISRTQRLELGTESTRILETLASLAAVAIDRRRRQRNSAYLREWLAAFGKLFAESKLPSHPRHRERLLQAIADNAWKISGADFVVLYEYFEDRRDVRLPPVLAGAPLQSRVMEGRGLALEHRKSVVFRLLARKAPFFAERAPEDWIEQGLIDRKDYPQEGSFFQREQVASSAGLPLRFDEERVGILFVNYRTEQTFSDEFRQHLELFADYAALAIGNTRLFRQAQQHTENLRILNQIGRDLASAVTRDIHQIGELIHQQTQTVIPAKNFFLCLYEAKQDQYLLPYIQHEADAEEIPLHRLHEGLTAYVCRTGEALLATAEQQQQLFSEGKAQLVGKPSAIWLGAPLVVRDKVIGAIVVQDHDDSTAFTVEHKNLLTAIASQAAIAIDNYRLIRNARLRLTELEALLDISQAFGSSKKNTTELLCSILDHVCNIAKCSGSLLLLIDPANKFQLRVAASSSSLGEYFGRTLWVDQGASGQVIKTGSPQIWNHYDERDDRSPMFDPPPKHVCAIPLFWQGEVIGALTLSSHDENRWLSQREIDILKRFAGSITAAVQNARDSSFRNALIHAGPNAIVAVDLAGRIVAFNEEAEILFGKKALLGESVTRLYWGRLAEAQRIQNLLEKNEKIRDEEIFGRSQDEQNEEKIPLSLSAALLRDDTGEKLGSVGILQDLRLQSLRGRTKLLVEGLQEIGREEDISKIVEIVVLYAVELLYADTGCLFLREHESFELASSYRTAEAYLQRLQAASVRLASLATAHPRQVIFLPQQESADELRLSPASQSAVLVPIHTDERLLGYLLVESREAEHFRAEERLIEILASQAAVSINRVQLLRYRERTQRELLVNANAVMVGQIATSFVHETKNSLNGMTLTVHNLRSDIEAEAELKRRKDYLDRLSVVLTEMQRLDDLSRRLQRFTRQGLRPEKQESHLNEVVKSSIQLLESVLREKQMRFEIRLDPRLSKPKGTSKGSPLFLDESQIQQALMNLILNAVAASPDRSPLQIETRDRGRHVEIRVRDFGAGISPDNKRNLFSPFFTTKTDGVGLGLYISKLMVEVNHDGKIEIENTTLGKGTTFLIRIPKPV